MFETQSNHFKEMLEMDVSVILSMSQLIIVLRHSSRIS